MVRVSHASAIASATPSPIDAPHPSLPSHHYRVHRITHTTGNRIAFDPDRSQALPSLVRKAMNSPLEPTVLWGTGRQYRDFLHVDDATDAVLATYDNGMNKGVVQVRSKVGRLVGRWVDWLSR